MKPSPESAPWRFAVIVGTFAERRTVPLNLTGYGRLPSIRMLSFDDVAPSSRGPGHSPFTAATGVRIPSGSFEHISNMIQIEAYSRLHFGFINPCSGETSK